MNPFRKYPPAITEADAIAFRMVAIQSRKRRRRVAPVTIRRFTFESFQ